MLYTREARAKKLAASAQVMVAFCGRVAGPRFCREVFPWVPFMSPIQVWMQS